MGAGGEIGDGADSGTIPTFIVPLLLITHALVFLILLRRDTVAA